MTRHSPKEGSWGSGAPCKLQVIPLRRGLKKFPWAHGKLAVVCSCLSQALEQNFSRLRKSKWRVSYRHACFQISAGIPHLPGALPSFAALMASNSSLNSCFSSKHAMFTGQRIELCQETRRRNRSTRHQYMHFLGITASLLDFRPLLGLL